MCTKCEVHKTKLTCQFLPIAVFFLKSGVNFNIISSQELRLEILLLYFSLAYIPQGRLDVGFRKEIFGIN
jgi:hypothetical protein